ncbi:MAG: hypothetical protein ACK4ND_01085 [Cytophagaceae bacterium]
MRFLLLFLSLTLIVQLSTELVLTDTAAVLVENFEGSIPDGKESKEEIISRISKEERTSRFSEKKSNLPLNNFINFTSYKEVFSLKTHLFILYCSLII